MPLRHVQIAARHADPPTTTRCRAVPDHAFRHIGPEQGLSRTLTAGRFLAPPGRYFPGLAREVPSDQLAAAVAEEAAAGSGWVKVVGDFPDDRGQLAGTGNHQSSPAAVGAAHAAGSRIAIHAVLPETIRDAVDAGFDAIEHGTGMPPDLVPVLAARGMIWTPTLIIDDGVRQWARHAMARPEWAGVDRWFAALPATVAAAARTASPSSPAPTPAWCRTA